MGEKRKRFLAGIMAAFVACSTLFSGGGVAEAKEKKSDTKSAAKALYGLTEREVTQADKTELENLIAEATVAEQAGQGAYTNESWAAFAEALAQARGIAAEETPSVIDASLSRLLSR